MKRLWFGITAVISLAVLTHWRWFFNFGILSKGDWGFFFQSSQRQLASWLSLWRVSTGLGGPDISASMYPVNLAMGGLARIVNFALSERLLYLWPAVLIAAVGSYLLVRKIVPHQLAAILGSLVYTYNTYFLSGRTGQVNLMVAFALTPLVLLAMMTVFERQSWRWSVGVGLLASVVAAYDFRAFYILAWLLLLYGLWFAWLENRPTNRREWLKLGGLVLLPLVIVALLNGYWLLAGGGAASGGLLTRNLFGNEFLNVNEALTLFHPFWTGAEPAVFQVQPIPFYFWLVPLAAFAGLVLERRNRRVAFFGLTALIGIFLTKQAGPPIAGSYQWLFSHLPGFGAFREASKFYSLIALGYAVLIGALIERLFRRRLRWAWPVTVILGLIFLFNARPLVNGSIETLFRPREVPSEYLALKAYLDKQPAFSRVLWVPRASRWGYYSDKHPLVSAYEMSGDLWKRLTPPGRLPGDALLEPLRQPESDQLLDQAAIGYVVVPLADQANDDDFFPDYFVARDFYIKELDKLPYLERLEIGADRLAVYRNARYHPHLDLPGSSFAAAGPSQYHLAVTGLRERAEVILADSFAPDWQIYADRAWSCRPAAIHEIGPVGTKPVTECADLSPAGPADLKFLTRQPLAIPHAQAAGYANWWELKADQLKKELPPSSLHQNADGSLDFNLILFYRPQARAIAGFIIALVTLAASIGVIVGPLVGKLAKRWWSNR